MKVVVGDVETNGLLDKLTRIHCLCLREIVDGVRGPIQRFRNNHEGDNIRAGLAVLDSADVVVFHNGVAFDIEAIEKVYPDWSLNPDVKIRDTLVMSRMLKSDIKDSDYRRRDAGLLEGRLIGSHGLESWGQRLGVYKGDYAKIREAEAREKGITDKEAIVEYVWGSWNQDMEDYCAGDIETTTTLWENLDSMGWSEEALRLEHRMAYVMHLQEQFGFQFDVEAARELTRVVQDDYDKLRAEVVSHFGEWFAPAKKYKLQPRAHFGEDESRTLWAEVLIPAKDTNYKPNPTRGFHAPTEYRTSAPFCKIELKEFNPNSRPQIIDRLQTIYGWTPVDFTENGTPEVNDDVLRELAREIPICGDLAELFFLNKLLGMVVNGDNAWLALVKGDGKIHGHVTVGGTISGRASHSNPNCGQIPKVSVADVNRKDGSWNPKVLDKVSGAPIADCFNEDGSTKKKIVLKGRVGKYGFECRSLFTAPPNWWLMGCDLSGIELRCLAARLAEFDGGEYVDTVLNGDPHTKNQIAFQVDSRDTAKTCLYACVPMDTRALTLTGWKAYEQLQVGEMILTYNAENGVQEWKSLLEKVFYEDAPIIELKTSNHFSFRSTPNHRWFVRKRQDGGNNGRYYTDSIVTTEELNSEHLIIRNAPLECGLTSCSFFPEKEAKYGTDWTQQVFEMPQDQRQHLLTGFMLADRHQIKGIMQWEWPQLHGEICEAMLLASYLVHDKAVDVCELRHAKNPMKRVLHTRKGFVTGQRLQKIVHPNAPVWCVRTENESWVARQGDCITITGNTMYGGGDLKIGSIVLPSSASAAEMTARGKQLKANLQNGIPAFGKLIKKVGRQAGRGYLDGLDGRKLWVRSKHAALNLQLQSDAALISKLWVIFFFDSMTDAGYVYGVDWGLCCWVHDEVQAACRTREIAEHAAEICKQCATEAGEYFNYSSPVAAEAKIGLTWSETH